MVAAWQLNLQAQPAGRRLVVCGVRSACSQFGAQFGETLARITDGSTSWESLGHPSVQQNDAVTFICGIAIKAS